MVKGKRVLADIEPELKKRLYRILFEKDMTFNEWVRQQIQAFLEENEPKLKRLKGKGA